MEDLRHESITQKYTQIKFSREKNGTPQLFTVESKEDGNPLATISFQYGPVKEAGINGVMNEDLIAMVISRLEFFQSGKFACKENEMALEKLYEALMWLRKRTTKREMENKEGTWQV